MSRTLQSPSNGGSLVNVLPDASGGTGVISIPEIISKFGFVPEAAAGIANGPVPLDIEGKVALSYLTGISQDPYGLNLPAQVMNSHNSIFEAQYTDSFTEYSVSVDKGSAVWRDGVIVYTPDTSWVGVVNLTFGGAKYTFQSVEKVLQAPVITNAAWSLSGTTYTVTVSEMGPQHTDGTRADARLDIVSCVDNNGVTIPYQSLRKESDSITTFTVKADDLTGDTLKFRFRHTGAGGTGPAGSIVSLYLASAKRVQALFDLSRDVEYTDDMSFVLLAQTTTLWNAAVDVSSVRPAMFKRESAMNLFQQYQSFGDSSSLSGFGRSSLSKSGNRLYIAAPKGVDGSVTGGRVVIHEYDALLKAWKTVGTISYRQGMGADPATGGNFAVGISANGSDTEVAVTYTGNPSGNTGGCYAVYDVTNPAAPVLKSFHANPMSTGEVTWSNAKVYFYNNLYMYICATSINAGRGNIIVYKKNGSGVYVYQTNLLSSIPANETFPFYESRILENVIGGGCYGDFAATTGTHLQWVVTTASDTHVLGSIPGTNAAFATGDGSQYRLFFIGFENGDKTKLLFARQRTHATWVRYTDAIFRINIDATTGAYVGMQTLAAEITAIDAVLKAYNPQLAIERFVLIDPLRRLAIVYGMLQPAQSILTYIIRY